jgi:hypothetical protein
MMATGGLGTSRRSAGGLSEGALQPLSAQKPDRQNSAGAGAANRRATAARPLRVVARLLAEAAHRHILDHARTQRGYRPEGKGEIIGGPLELKVAGPLMLGIGSRSSPLTGHPLTDTADNAQRSDSRESGFVHRHCCHRPVPSLKVSEAPLLAAIGSSRRHGHYATRSCPS